MTITENGMRGRLHFYSETGTEGGLWAFQEEQHINKASPNFGVYGGTEVFDANDPERRGKTKEEPFYVQKEDGWRPLPDPLQQDDDYYVSSLFQGQGRGDREADARLAERYGFTFEYLDTDYGTPRTKPELRPYGVGQGELTRVVVDWEDGETEERLSNTLLTEQWSYAGLHVLQDGDHLRIYEKDGLTLAWEGEIKLHQYELFDQSVFGYWIHADMEGWEREEWARLFFGGRPAELSKGMK